LSVTRNQKNKETKNKNHTAEELVQKESVEGSPADTMESTVERICGKNGFWVWSEKGGVIDGVHHSVRGYTRLNQPLTILQHTRSDRMT